MSNFILHIHPKSLPEKTLKFSLTFGLGGMALTLLVLQAFTGILLRFMYVPTPAEAYDSVMEIKNNLVLGSFVRNVHYWSGSLLIITAFFHLLRVFLTDAFHDKRKINWIFGMVLFILIILSNFTGYLLPWDQLAYWAVTVVSNMLGYIPLFGDGIRQFVLQGTEVSGTTLNMFFNLHTGLIPLALIIMMGFHFWKVRKAGGVVIPGGEPRKGQKMVHVMPNLVFREMVVALSLIALVFLMSSIFEAPLMERANPQESPNPAKAPWYFLGFQELLLNFHPFISVMVIPLITLTLLFAIPYINYDDPHPGVWFYSSKGKKITMFSGLLSLIITPVFIVLNEKFFKQIINNSFFNQGFFLFIIIVFILAGMYYFIKKFYKANRSEWVLGLFVFLTASFMILTINGIFFRGKGMLLTFPW